MTYIIYYADRAQPDSSLVTRAWYDADYRKLYLELSGSVYSYGGVQAATYIDLVNADSPGNYYSNNIKGNKKYVGSRLGPVADAKEVNVRPQPEVEKVEFANDGYIKSNGEASFPNVQSKFIDRTNVPKLSLVQDVPTPDTDNYTLEFVVDGAGLNVRTHTVKAHSVDSAMDQLFTLANTLGVSVTVKAVTVRFE